MTAPRPPNLRHFFAVLLCVFFQLSACGGGEGAAKHGADAPESAAAREDSSESDDGEAEAAEAEAESASGPNCDDGTCSLCAGSLCPNGWYCNEDAKACGWLRECPEKPSCACVTRVLGSSCKCTEEGGVPHVTCG